DGLLGGEGVHGGLLGAQLGVGLGVAQAGHAPGGDVLLVGVIDVGEAGDEAVVDPVDVGQLPGGALGHAVLHVGPAGAVGLGAPGLLRRELGEVDLLLVDRVELLAAGVLLVAGVGAGVGHRRASGGVVVRVVGLLLGMLL